MSAADPKPLSAESLLEIAFVSDPRISPDGGKIVYCVKKARLEENEYAVGIHLVSATGGSPRRLTFGEHTDVLPRWAPDGRSLAFVSNRHDKRQQVYVLPMEGGEARRLTDVDGSFSDLQWSPDGKRLVAAFRARSREQIERRDAEERGEGGKRPVFQVHRSVHYKEDGLGFLFDTHAHLVVIDVETGETKQITEGNTDDMQPVFSPDGTRIAFASNRMDQPEMNPDNLDICLVPVTGGEIRRLTSAYGLNMAPAFSPDGKTLAFLGCFVGKGEFWRDCRVLTIPAAGGEARNLTPDLPRSAGNLTVSDTSDVGVFLEPPIWSRDGSTLTFQISEDGSVLVCRVPASGGEVQRITPPGREVNGLSVDARGGRMAMTVSTHRLPAEIAVLDLDEGGEPRLLTGHNREFVNSHRIAEPEEIRVVGPGGEVHGWILKPPGFDPAHKHPMILEIHGGPHAQYANTFFHEMQHLAGKGYVVVWSNPRGSQGYGEAFAGAIVRDWGGPDYEDLMAVVDDVLARGYVDPERMGVTGGSYGGFMTNWIVGHTDRFRAAATQRSVVNLYSFYGESDFGFGFEWELFGRPWEDEETALRYLRMSPINYVKNIKTPLLIIHSEEDHRCPISQAEELFTALKMLGQEVEFVRFEGESHGLSRGGRPQNRLERLRRLGEWFDRHLHPSGRTQ